MVRRVLRTSGIDAFVYRKGYHYVPDQHGRSAHKELDIRRLPGFGKLAEQVISHGTTLLYYDRLYIVYQALVGLKGIADVTGSVDLVEVGVYKGGTSYFIAAAVEQLGLKGATVHCFDTFEGHPAEDIRADVDTCHRAGSFASVEFEAVRRYLEVFPNVRLYQGRFQDTCRNLEATQVHFAHVDVDIYEPTRCALEFLDRRLVRGGVVVVDDYGFVTCPGVRQAVDEFVLGKPDYLSLHLLTGQNVLVKR